MSKKSDELEYWREELRKLKGSGKFICDLHDDEYESASYTMFFDKKYGTKVNKICKSNKFLMYAFLVSTLKINLSKYMFKKNITIGIPSYNTFNKKKIIYSKVLPLTSYVDYEKTYLEYMMSVKEQILDIYKNQDYLNSMVLLESNLSNDVMELVPLSICMKNLHEKKYIDYICCSSKNEISFLLETFKDNSIKLEIVYNNRKFSRIIIEKLAKSNINVLKEVLNNLNHKIKDIKILSEEETNQILYEFNDTKVEYPRDKTIQELFEEQVEKTPDNIAVVFEDTQLTYRELNEKSNQLARILRRKGVQPDSIVGIMVERSLEMVIGIMGILKAGGAYLPIDPNYPKERIDCILKDSKSELLVSTKDILDNYKFSKTSIDLLDEELFEKEKHNLDVINKTNDLVYVIYTSGTTAKPKGVMIEHSNLSNYCNWFKRVAALDLNDESLFLSSYAFDLGYTTLFTTLLTGIKLTILSKDHYMNPKKLIEKIAENTTYIKITPSMFNMIVNHNDFDKIFKNQRLRLIVLGGESINIKDIKKFNSFNQSNVTKIINHYGPTETTIGSISTFDAVAKLEKSNNIIGKPNGNTCIYIVNKEMNLVPVGIPGEICISGSGLARGYINRHELTAEKFVKNPFKNGQRMYKTGDLARWLPDGNIEFLGRIDNQVKIRGFRIEIGEIENRLLQHEEIKEATVVVKENKEKEKYICAYVVSEKEIKELDLRSYLKESLPEYMIPSYFVSLEKMPLTYNGKLDRRALPEPNIDMILNEYEAPRNEVEEKLTDIWSDVLSIKRIGINDDFFELGGNSLRIISVISKIKETLGIEFPIKAMIENPTIKQSSKFLLNKKSLDLKAKCKNVMLLNSKKNMNIFAFPAISGLGLAYKRLADSVDTCSLYAFDFIKEDNRVQKYADSIIYFQSKGPYILLAWSAGGNLAVEVENELRRRGFEVSDLILIDVNPFNENKKVEKDELKRRFEEYKKIKEEVTEFNNTFHEKYQKENYYEMVYEYFKYTNEKEYKEQVNSNIHLIKAMSLNRTNDVDMQDEKWKQLTKKKFYKYNAFGLHHNIITRFAKRNSIIIKEILEEISKQNNN